MAWWERRRQELVDGASEAAGGKLKTKLEDIGAEDTQIAMAVDLRLRYGAEVRTPRYMEDSQIERLQVLVRSKMATLRSSYVAGEIDPNGQGFHALCLKEMDQDAVWDEVDFENAVWTIPKERMKRSKAHNVYLSQQCLDIMIALKTCAGNSRSRIISSS